MKAFQDKQQIFDYVGKKFKDSELILVRGSTATKPIKDFSDIDLEIWGAKLKKPYYEIIFLKKSPVLITAYFYKYKKGKEITSPTNVKIISGKYNKSLEKSFTSKEHFVKDKYTPKQKIKREIQLATDFFFKYLRTKDKKYLNSVQKRI